MLTPHICDDHLKMAIPVFISGTSERMKPKSFDRFFGPI